jgi:hypothetical protein
MKKYGRELMTRAGYPQNKVSKAVEALGEDFPDHSYVIDSREARRLGLRVYNPAADTIPLIDSISEMCGKMTIIGRISVKPQP